MTDFLPSKNEVALMPCPFCREPALTDRSEAFWFNGGGPPPCYAVRCDSCGAQGPFGYGRGRGDHWGAQDQAAERWNALARPAVETESLTAATITENTQLRVVLSTVCETWVNGRRVLDGISLTTATEVRRLLGMPSQETSGLRRCKLHDREACQECGW